MYKIPFRKQTVKTVLKRALGGVKTLMSLSRGVLVPYTQGSTANRKTHGLKKDLTATDGKQTTSPQSTTLLTSN